MAWQNYIPHAMGGAAVTGSTALVLFRDAIKDTFKSWEDEKRARRAERLAEANKKDTSWVELITLFKEAVHDQKLAMVKTNELLERMTIAHEKNIDLQRIFSNQMNDVDKRLYRIEGANGIQ